MIHLVRHAQGFHNLTTVNHSLPDPSLTPFGLTQCTHLSKTFPYHSAISTIIASPLRRTIYTALHTFPTEIAHGIKIIALPELQETGNIPCDTGTDATILRAEFRDEPVDLSLLTEGWNSNIGKWAPTSEAIASRAREARIWLRQQKGDVAVVTHGGFLHYLTEDWEGYKKSWGTGWANCEYRSYRFKEEDDEDASLVETEDSKEMRRKADKPRVEMDRAQFTDAAIREWEKKGIESSRKGDKDDRDWIGAF